MIWPWLPLAAALLGFFLVVMVGGRAAGRAPEGGLGPVGGPEGGPGRGVLRGGGERQAARAGVEVDRVARGRGAGAREADAAAGGAGGGDDRVRGGGGRRDGGRGGGRQSAARLGDVLLPPRRLARGGQDDLQ